MPKVVPEAAGVPAAAGVPEAASLPEEPLPEAPPPDGLKIGAIFAGIGGLDVACEWTWPGARTVYQVDLVGAAIRRRHFPGALQVEADIVQVDPQTLPSVDVLCGGSPCQDLSVAGNGAGLDGARSGLYREVLRFAGADPADIYPQMQKGYRWVSAWANGRTLRKVPGFPQPRYVVLENVPPLLRYMKRLVRDFQALGYGLSWCVVEAADAGHPHMRRRVFVLAELDARGRGRVEADTRGRWSATTERTWPTALRADAEMVKYHGARGATGGGEALKWSVRTWPTARASDSRSPGQYDGREGGPTLSEAIRTWPTPTAGDARASGSRSLASDAHAGTSPTDAVRPDRAVAEDRTRTWATPTVTEQGESLASWEARRQRNIAKGYNGNGQGELLDMQARTWATPNARDFKQGQLPDRVGSDPLPVQAETPGGKRLNPEWVEMLMGYPQGWTASEGPQLVVDPQAPAVRGRYPATWDRTVPWPGFSWEPPRTLPDGEPAPGRPARIKALGNAVVPQEGALALRALVYGGMQRSLF